MRVRGVFRNRLLLEKLLNYAIKERKDNILGESQQNLDSSIDSFKIPQSILDELEELGVDTMRLINGIIDQYSFLFTKRKRATKRTK